MRFHTWSSALACRCDPTEKTNVSQADETDSSLNATNTLTMGCRQGVVTAFALFSTLSIAFLRFWSFEAPGS